MTTVIHKDIVILGGGIAGLWLLRRLRAQGFDAILLEAEALGSGQTIASQGMIHGGIKYALKGSLTRASNTIADMPAHWKNCIAGKGDVDLRDCRVLSQHYFMWPRDNLRSRLNAFLGSKALRGRVEALDPDRYPTFFRKRISGPLYQLTDIVLDIPSLLETLSAPVHNAIFHASPECLHIRKYTEQSITSIDIEKPDHSLRIQARRYVIASGAGTESLLARHGLNSPAMQRRPLHMVMVKHRIPDPVYVHSVAGQFSSTPELTLTTHYCNDGSTVWYIGGELAESGVNRSTSEQINIAKERLNTLFPWCDLTQAQWRSFLIDRAEARQVSGNRPDNAFIKAYDNYLVCWPTKLTLAPALASSICQFLSRQGMEPDITQADGPTEEPMPALEVPGIASPPWETLF